MRKKIITIDGPAGSGKSTVSRLLAKTLGYFYLDTGAMYRAVALMAKRKGILMEDAEKLGHLCEGLDLRFTTQRNESRLYIGEEDISSDIRSPEMDMLSSSISAVKEVRKAMTALQQKIGSGGGVVAEGRDMGTVVFPEADVKFFLDASSKTRALRRYQELDTESSQSLEEVSQDMQQRDTNDSTRSLAPLRPAEDAIRIDSSELSVQKVVDLMLSHIDKNR